MVAMLAAVLAAVAAAAEVGAALAVAAQPIRGLTVELDLQVTALVAAVLVKLAILMGPAQGAMVSHRKLQVLR